MGKRTVTFDNYISKSEVFARPILTYLRDVMHDSCPEIEEKSKWGMPFFVYKNDNLCHMASFKKHCALGFWKAPLFSKNKLPQVDDNDKAMGQFGKISSINELPSKKVLQAFIKESIEIIDKGIKPPPKPKVTKAELPLHLDFLKALSKTKKALQVFHDFSLSHRNEYAGWINEAKTEATRNKRIEQAIEWLNEGKGKNWKYERK
ncbi:MAG: YdeI/OmpD-associated family protein [Bacteroidetes bacterium]|nr:YdeI/OmpD-associated family protein [Bacteroidota bacterium]